MGTIAPASVVTALATAMALAVATAPAGAQGTSPAAGTWSGTIAAPGGGLALTITLQQDAGGAWTGTMDIPAQGAKGLRLGDVAVDGSSVSFRVLVGAGTPSATARLSDDGARLSGTFTQGGASFPLDLTRGSVAASIPTRPQEPAPPFPYVEEDVSYRNDPADVRLAGTLTRPSAGGPFPAVLLITGSGAQDRDETIFGHKPFLVLADHLTRRGLAVLRVDDRGVGGSDRGPATATSRDFAGDVRAGVSYLKGRADIDAARVGLIGHSEGANIAAMVAAESSDIRFIVMLAGAGVPGDEILYLQSSALGRLQGASEEVIAWDRAIRQRVYEQVKSETDGVADAAGRRALMADLPPLPGTADPEGGRSLATTLLQAASGPWFRHFLAYDPAPTIARVTCPVLAIIGEKDVQVPPRENLPAIERALQSSPNPDYTVMPVPQLNHLFQTSATGSPAEYGSIEETFAPSALTLVSDWIVARVGR